MRLLIVEDEPLIGRDIRRMLTLMGHEVLGVLPTGEQAVQLALEQPPDLILMDIQLRGEVNGIAAAHRIYDQADVPSVFVTAHSDHETLQQVKAGHPFGYVLKPIEYRELQAAIEMAAAMHAADQKLRQSQAKIEQIYQAEHEQRRFAETLIEASQVLTANLDVDVVLDNILDQIGRVVKNDVCNIMLIENGATQVVRHRGYEAFEAEVFIETFVFPLSGLPIRQQIINTNQPVFVSDVRTDPQWALPAGAAWLSSYVAAPISLQNKVIGFINVGSTTPGFYTAQHAQRLHAFGHQAALAFQNARLFNETHKTAATLQVLSRRLLEAQETERRYIARELHDDIGQSLTAAKLVLQAGERATALEGALSRLREGISIVDFSLQRVRQISLDLHPSVLDDLGLIPALRWFADREAQWGEFATRVIVEEMQERLPADIEAVCFRLVQEALTNISRHACARNVTIELWQRNNELHVVVRDDGIGFDVRAANEAAIKGNSLGLQGMYERVMLVNGRLEINSEPGSGTEIHARIPLPAGAPQEKQP